MKRLRSISDRLGAMLCLVSFGNIWTMNAEVAVNRFVGGDDESGNFWKQEQIELN